MADFVDVPPGKVPQEALRGLLEEYASRDGTDYGQRETPLPQRVEQLQQLLMDGQLRLLFDTDSEQWDLVSSEDAARLLGDAEDLVGS